jgi:hypothetical protein
LTYTQKSGAAAEEKTWTQEPVLKPVHSFEAVSKLQFRKSHGFFGEMSVSFWRDLTGFWVKTQ